ncbi:MAG TPA: winged helix-turn-helix domain-containing protein [Candidatus Norongarragalinales archaeon]|nr:winged helix-turn-helix domain-containing protein [Candidatus Norongarragalinales archaeon]
MDLKLKRRKDASFRNLTVLGLLLLAVGGLYYQNILAFDSHFSSQEGAFEPTNGPPLLGSGSDSKAERAAIQEDANLGAPALKSANVPQAPAALATQPLTLTTETYREKGPLQEPALYYVAIGLLGLLLFLNIFKVSFQTSAVFDSDIFKALSSETRVEMLYALQERRKTLSELANEVDISLPGAKQHLSLLETKGLVRKMDEGRKWKYYELTDQGKSIIAERFA